MQDAEEFKNYALGKSMRIPLVIQFIFFSLSRICALRISSSLPFSLPLSAHPL